MKRGLILLVLILITIFTVSASYVCDESTTKNEIKKYINLLEEEIQNAENIQPYGDAAVAEKDFIVKTLKSQQQTCRDYLCHYENYDLFNSNTNECGCATDKMRVASNPAYENACCDPDTQVVNPYSGACTTCENGKVPVEIKLSPLKNPMKVCQCPAGQLEDEFGVCGNPTEAKVSDAEKKANELESELSNAQNENALTKQDLQNQLEELKSSTDSTIASLQSQLNNADKSIDSLSKDIDRHQSNYALLEKNHEYLIILSSVLGGLLVLCLIFLMLMYNKNH